MILDSQPAGESLIIVFFETTGRCNITPCMAQHHQKKRSVVRALARLYQVNLGGGTPAGQAAAAKIDCILTRQYENQLLTCAGKYPNAEREYCTGFGYLSGSEGCSIRHTGRITELTRTVPEEPTKFTPATQPSLIIYPFLQILIVVVVVIFVFFCVVHMPI
jgi:hypothetical protein